MLESRGFWLYFTAVVAAALATPGVPTYWDTWDYVRHALSGEVGGLGFGRPAFVGVSHAIVGLWINAGGSVWHLEHVLHVFWTLLACASAPLTWRLAAAGGHGCSIDPVRPADLAGIVAAVLENYILTV